MMSNLWVSVQLGDIADFLNGFAFKSSMFEDSGEYQVLKLGNIKQGNLLLSKAPAFISVELAQEFIKHLPQVGDILITMTGTKFKRDYGFVCLIEEENKHLVNQRVGNIKSSKSLNSNFLSHYLSSEAFKDNFFLGETGGVNQGNVGSTHILKCKIPFPPLAEQKVIADKLDTLLAQVETSKARLERIPQILKTFRQSVLAAAVSGKLTEEWRGENEISLTLERYKNSLGDFKVKAKGLKPIIERENWLECQFGHVFSVKSGDGLTAKKMASDGTIPVYGGNGINGYHDKNNVSESKVVIGRVGFYCGSVHLTEQTAWVTDNALLVDFSVKILNEKFVFWLLNATNLREDSASSAQPVISGTKIYPITLYIPPIEEQIEIVRQVEELFAFAARIEQKANAALERVNNLTQSILAKAFRGELTADWRAQNPDLISGENSAEALLAKIKAEREALSSKKKPKKKAAARKKA